jgi:hypothetical protein
MNNKRWRATDVGPAKLTENAELDNRLTDFWGGRINRLVLRARSWQNGVRYGDKLSRPRSHLMSLVLPSGQWGRPPEGGGLNAMQAECPCLPEPGLCSELVMCCFCDPPGGAHNGSVSTRDECLREGGTILGGPDESADGCRPLCENQASGSTNQRLGELIPDPLRQKVQQVWRKIARSTIYKGGKPLEARWKQLLRETAAETAVNPVLRNDDGYDRIAKEEQSKFDAKQIPVSDTVDGIYLPMARRGNETASSAPCGCGNDRCAQTGPFFDWFKQFDQRKRGVWNYIPPGADCCGAHYGSVSYTMEMDWPCEDTADAYVRAKQKYDFGKAAFEEAKRYCAQGNPDEPPGEGQGTPECGGPGGPIHKPHLCHPLARELIGAEPPNLVPCIKTCPLQTGDAACQDEGWRRWPQGDYVPYGENVEQNIPCLGGADVSNKMDPADPPAPENPGEAPVVEDVIVTPTGELGCSFRTNKVERNFSSIESCGEHQCGIATCGGQFCCKVDCIELDCCEQLTYNPATGEFAEYDDRGCMIDKDGNKIGGWRVYPDEDGTYFRCPQQEVQTYDTTTGGGNQVLCPGCTESRTALQTCFECGPTNIYQPTCSGTGVQCEPRGDILAWSIPRKRRNAAQGEYPRHCPDHLEPFEINLDDPNYFYYDKCDRSILPSIGDRGFCWYDPRNPSGDFCTGGFCSKYQNQDKFGAPYHQWPIEDIEHKCVAGYSGPKGPCEREWKRAPPDYEPPDDPLSPTGGGGGRPDDPDQPGSGGDDCSDYILMDMLLDVGHSPAACGATPCDDKGVYVNRETGEKVDVALSPGGPPDDSGNWIRAGCVRCSYDGVGRPTRDNAGCNGDPCQGPQGYLPNHIAYGDGYTSEEMGLQHITITCGVMPHRVFEQRLYPPYQPICGDINDLRPKYDGESHFKVSLEYKGAGTGYSGYSRPRKGMSRQGQGQFTLAKSADAPTSCIFGHYTKLTGTNDGWFTGGGANPAPYWQTPNPGDDYYYKETLGLTEAGGPDCERRIWTRPHNLFGCKFSTPSVLII